MDWSRLNANDLMRRRGTEAAKGDNKPQRGRAARLEARADKMLAENKPAPASPAPSKTQLRDLMLKERKQRRKDRKKNRNKRPRKAENLRQKFPAKFENPFSPCQPLDECT